MRSAIFASAFHPSVGGVEETVLELAHEQRRRGDRPVILTNRWPRSLPDREQYDGLSVRRYAFRVPDRPIKQLVSSLLLNAATLRHVCADLRADRTELLHVQCVSCGAYYALRAKRRLGLPLVVTLQGELTMDATGLFQRSPFARSLMRSTLAAADAITACSAQTLDEAQAFFGQPFGERASVIYNGVRLHDFDRLTPYSHVRPYILAIGRLVKQKGFDVLLRAFALTRHSGVHSHDLLLAGDGPERPHLARLASELALSDCVRFTGPVEHAEALRLFAGCAFFVLPSRHEPMGIVNLEAMAAGKAVIASRVGGVPELVDDERTGLLVPGDDAPALERAIVRLDRKSVV